MNMYRFSLIHASHLCVLCVLCASAVHLFSIGGVMSIVIWPEQSDAWVAAIREAAGDVEVVTPASEAEAMAAARTAEGWIGRLNPALLDSAPRLRWLQAPIDQPGTHRLPRSDRRAM